MRRPIVYGSIQGLITRGLKKHHIDGDMAFYALGQLIAISRENERLADKFRRLRATHLNLINKLKKEIETLEKEIDFLKEQRSPTPQCYTVDGASDDPNSWDENELARAIHTGGFQIPRF